MSRRSLPSPAPDTDTLRTRLDRARAAVADAYTDGALVAPGSDLRYLIGTAGGSFERLTTLVLPAKDRPALVVPKLEVPGFADVATEELGIDLVTWTDGDDPYRLVAELLGTPSRVAVSDTMIALHVLGLREALGQAEQILAGPLLRELRICKDVAEVAALRRAGEAIDRVHAKMGEWLRPGRTEADVAADIAAAIVDEGHVQAEFIIVGSGPNGASPHHDVSDRVIERGDLVVVDIGGPLPGGYNSDCTRTYAVGEPDPDAVSMYQVLQRAQRAAVDTVRPGVAAQDVDAAARNIIAEAGFGEYFIHRTGHGIGLDVHEEPYIVKGNDLPLESGMAFSIEPGIYVPGRWGARLEDIVVVGAEGAEPLNNRPHELTVLPV